MVLHVDRRLPANSLLATRIFVATYVEIVVCYEGFIPHRFIIDRIYGHHGHQREQGWYFILETPMPGLWNARRQQNVRHRHRMVMFQVRWN